MPSTRGGNYNEDAGYEVEFNKTDTMHTSNTSEPLQRDYSRRTTNTLSSSSSSSRENSRHGGPVDMGGPIDTMGPIDLDDMSKPLHRDYLKPLQRDHSRRTTSKSSSTSHESSGPIDLDEIFNRTRIMDEDYASLFSSSGDEDSALIMDTAFMDSEERRYFSNPNKHLLDTDASLIPGSPFSKPPNKPSNRPNAPLSLAKYASTLAFLLTVGWVGSLFFFAIWNYTTVSRIM
jgi:hypothetical protein